MSLSHRNKAIDIIAHSLDRIYSQTTPDLSRKVVANHILNQLLRGGYLNEKVLVHVDEIKDELDKSIFKCKVEE